MGGRGGGSGRGGGGGGSRSGLIDRTAFIDEGGGTYQLDIPGLGGGFIASGPNPWGLNVAEAKVWDADYEVIKSAKYGSVNAAKQFIKETLKDHVKK